MDSWPTEYPAPGNYEGFGALFRAAGSWRKRSRRKSRGQAAPGSTTSARSAGSFRLSAPGTNKPIKHAVGPYGTGNARCDRVFSGDNTKNRRNRYDDGKQKTKKGFWPSEDLDEKIDIYLQLDNCSSRSEFVENALRFYIGYLNTKNAGDFLPEAFSVMMTGTLDYYAGRIGSQLFKQGVDLHVLLQIIAYDTDIDEGEYQRLRGKAIRDMKRTNGRISFKDALDFQKSV